MAVTKTHPIKSTLKAAIDYILNPEKTDGKLLASSFGCGLETADIEFAWTREAAGDRGTHLGRHLIQSFAVGETTPEEAHKIGMELAGAVLGGKYEFVLTTHVDKDHLHNHLIFNAVSFVDYKKYHSNKQSYHFIRRTSDRICKEHGLSVVVPGQDKGKSYAEYTAEKQGTSYKAKLKTAIDTLIPQVKDFDELLRRLQEMGYEIKQGKYISFRAAGQERFTRTKTLGAAYTEEAIKERIKGVYVAKTKTLREDKKIRLVVDLENSIKAQQSAGYERWAKIHNLKQAAKSMNFLTENKIEYYSELESKIADIMTAHDAAAKAVKEVEQRMERITERNFEMMSGKYQKEQLEIEARLKEVTETLNDSYEKSQGVRDFLSLIRNYQGLKELDATIINALIDKILVSEREKLADGTVRQEIKIYYKFIGFVGELHITPTKRWTALKPKNCTVCGVEYVPSSGISKYCPACAKRIQREKSNESKRRSRERNRRACIELSAKNDRLIKNSIFLNTVL